MLAANVRSRVLWNETVRCCWILEDRSHSYGKLFQLSFIKAWTLCVHCPFLWKPYCPCHIYIYKKILFGVWFQFQPMFYPKWDLGFIASIFSFSHARKIISYFKTCRSPANTKWLSNPYRQRVSQGEKPFSSLPHHALLWRGRVTSTSVVPGTQVCSDLRNLHDRV